MSAAAGDCVAGLGRHGVLSEDFSFGFPQTLQPVGGAPALRGESCVDIDPGTGA